jgi:glycosyltransferase involved in cell wall biosynthesis
VRTLLVHQNFPGQFKHLVPALIARGHQVVAIGGREFEPLPGMTYLRWRPACSTGETGHPWSRDFDTKVIRAEAVLRVAQELRRRGFEPDVIMAHPGWGEAMFLKDVWPSAVLKLYCEYYYQPRGADVGFDPEFPMPSLEDNDARMRIRNIAFDMAIADAANGISPTYWQAETFPETFQSRIEVVHDGIDTRQILPRDKIRLTWRNGSSLGSDDELITFVGRNLEPYRGYHMFMRALPFLQKLRPNAHVLIAGSDGVSYGAAPPAGHTWKQIFLDEVRDRLDLGRVHFLGQLPYDHFLAMLAASRVHVYLTYPFVLSWSLLEAMASGCAIVASDTAPVREVIQHDSNGLLVPFFEPEAIAKSIAELSGNAERRQHLSCTARAVVTEQYDLQSVCLPKQVRWIEGV